MCNSVKSLTSLVVFLQCVSTFGKYKPSRVSASHKMKVANVYYIKSSCAVILREILKTHVIGVLMLKNTHPNANPCCWYTDIKIHMYIFLNLKSIWLHIYSLYFRSEFVKYIKFYKEIRVTDLPN